MHKQTQTWHPCPPAPWWLRCISENQVRANGGKRPREQARQGESQRARDVTPALTDWIRNRSSLLCVIDMQWWHTVCGVQRGEAQLCNLILLCVWQMWVLIILCELLVPPALCTLSYTQHFKKQKFKGAWPSINHRDKKTPTQVARKCLIN